MGIVLSAVRRQKTRPDCTAGYRLYIDQNVLWLYEWRRGEDYWRKTCDPREEGVWARAGSVWLPPKGGSYMALKKLHGSEVTCPLACMVRRLREGSDDDGADEQDRDQTLRIARDIPFKHVVRPFNM
jgi:hypothetical protein